MPFFPPLRPLRFPVALLAAVSRLRGLALLRAALARFGSFAALFLELSAGANRGGFADQRSVPDRLPVPSAAGLRLIGAEASFGLPQRSHQAESLSKMPQCWQRVSPIERKSQDSAQARSRVLRW